MSKVRRLKPHNNKGFIRYTGSSQQLAVRAAGYTSATEREALERGNGIFWSVKFLERGEILIKVYDDKRVAKNLGVEYTGDIISCPLDVVADQARFDVWLAELKEKYEQ